MEDDYMEIGESGLVPIAHGKKFKNIHTGEVLDAEGEVIDGDEGEESDPEDDSSGATDL